MTLNRLLKRISDFYINEDDHYVDYKIRPSDVKFPRHTENMNGEVIVYKIEDLQEELH